MALPSLVISAPHLIPHDDRFVDARTLPEYDMVPLIMPSPISPTSPSTQPGTSANASHGPHPAVSDLHAPLLPATAQPDAREAASQLNQTPSPPSKATLVHTPTLSSPATPEASEKSSSAVTPAIPADATVTLTLLGTSPLSRGHTWEVYSASISISRGGFSLRPPLKVVAKFAIPWYDLGLLAEAGDSEAERLGESREAAVINEAKLYMGPLVHLQGGAVPQFYGLWRGTHDWTSHSGRTSGTTEMFVMILEDVGMTLDAADDASLVQFLPTLADLYYQLWDANVAHNDVELRHIHSRTETLSEAETRLAAGTLSVCLVDFDRAFTSTPGEGDHNGKLDACMMNDWRQLNRLIATIEQGASISTLILNATPTTATEATATATEATAPSV